MSPAAWGQHPALRGVPLTAPHAQPLAGESCRHIGDHPVAGTRSMEDRAQGSPRAGPGRAGGPCGGEAARGRASAGPAASHLGGSGKGPSFGHKFRRNQHKQKLHFP